MLAEKEFAATTTAEIARSAGVTEALIYKYFTDKRNLLHQVLAEYLEGYLYQAESRLKCVRGALDKLRTLIWARINMYSTNRVLARILLLEVRNFPDYFKSDAYEIVKRYNIILTQIIEQGAADCEIRTDVPASVISRVVLGAIDQLCLSGVIFSRDICPDELTDYLCTILFDGLAVRSSRAVV